MPTKTADSTHQTIYNSKFAGKCARTHTYTHISCTPHTNKQTNKQTKKKNKPTKELCVSLFLYSLLNTLCSVFFFAVS